MNGNSAPQGKNKNQFLVKGGTSVGAIGGGAVAINRVIMRSDMDSALCYLSTFGIAIVAVILWFVIASSLRTAIGR